MNDRFNFVGKLKLLKEDSLKTNDYDSGWQNTTLSFMVISGTNSEFLRINAGRWKDGIGKSTTIYTLKKSEEGKKCEKLEVAWNDRQKPEIIDIVAPFKKFTIDLDIAKPVDGAPAMYAQYIHEYDFITALYNVLYSGKYSEDIFMVTGDIEYSYSADKGEYYKNFKPTSIKRVAPDTEQTLTGHMVLNYTDMNGDTLVGTYGAYTKNDDGEATFHAYSKFYDGRSKKNGYAPYDICVPKEIVDIFGKCIRLDHATDVNEIGVKVRFINGAPLKTDVDENSMTETQREYLALGLITEAEIRAERGRGVYGDKITKIEITGLSAGYTNGAKKTEMDYSALTVPPIADARPFDAAPAVKAAENKVAEEDDLSDLLGGIDIFKTV